MEIPNYYTFSPLLIIVFSWKEGVLDISLKINLSLKFGKSEVKN